jgi:nitrite reductase/ring-hydroxylating ferredoxin subunit
LKYKLCQLEEFPPGSSRGFTVVTPDGTEDIFLVRASACIVAYRNSCPHTGGPLDWVPDQFLSLDGDLIQCATHDALFRIDDGVCVKGPCTGQSLQAITVEVEGKQVSVILDKDSSDMENKKGPRQ